MCAVKVNSSLKYEMQNYITSDFSPHFDQLSNTFSTEPKWQKLKQLGTTLWLDTGSIGDTQSIWTREFSGLTVNNTLLNKEIQAGTYDDTITEINEILNEYPDITGREKNLEISFALNACHGLKLVEKFDAVVSLEEHTDLAYDVDLAVDYAKRIYAVCPERFIIKIPFTAAGLLATRKLSVQGVPVNHTLGFSARQNYIIGRIANPAYVNVFLGRLNSFIASNDLGSGEYIGEKAVLASQKAIIELRAKNQSDSLQIGASFRAGRQVYDLAGLDVMTIPPSAAGEYRDLDVGLDTIEDRTDWNYTPGLNEDIDPESINLNTLWDIDQKLIECVDELEKEDLDSFTTDDLYGFFEKHNCSDVLVKWTDAQRETSYSEGKIPELKNWNDALQSRQIGLDSLMNLAGLNSFTADQLKMDKRVEKVLAQKG